jgi:hypothetical protein
MTAVFIKIAVPAFLASFVQRILGACSQEMHVLLNGYEYLMHFKYHLRELHHIQHDADVVLRP